MSLDLPLSDPCPFCEYLQERAPCAFVERTPTVTVFVNPTQYEPGALLIVSNVHVASVLDASEEMVRDIHQAAQRWAGRLLDVLGATGVNVFQNNGRSAGQTVAHYHVHVVPRYAGSDPSRRFRESEFTRASDEELSATAAQLARGG
jgi:histidine triad (HIT) family protein